MCATFCCHYLRIVNNKTISICYFYLEAKFSNEQEISVTCRGTFHSMKLQAGKGADPASYANVSELQSLMAVFGACGARELGSRSERPLEVAVVGLIEALNAHEPILQYLHQKMQASPSEKPRMALSVGGFWFRKCEAEANLATITADMITDAKDRDH